MHRLVLRKAFQITFVDDMDVEHSLQLQDSDWKMKMSSLEKGGRPLM